MRALLVDDDSVAAGRLNAVLGSAGFTIEHIDAGDEALNIVKHYDFDVMVLELDLPGIDGIKLVRRIRAADLNVPIMILSRCQQKEMKIDVLNAGADDYLTKPFDPDELIVRLRSLIRRSRGHAASVIRIGRMTVDLGTKTVEIDGKPLHVTSKEYSILELLALRRGMTLTKEVFLDHLYGGMDEPEQKIIDVFICKLRKKIAAVSGHQNTIRTIWGRGYTLDEGDLPAPGLAEEALPFSGWRLPDRGTESAAVDPWVTELNLLMLDLLRTAA